MAHGLSRSPLDGTPLPRGGATFPGGVGRPQPVQWPAAVVGEGDPVRFVGIALSAELSPVVLAMVVLAEAEQVRRVRRTSVLPVLDVVHMQPAAAVAARYPAPTISDLDDEPRSVGHGAKRPSGGAVATFRVPQTTGISDSRAAASASLLPTSATSIVYRT